MMRRLGIARVLFGVLVLLRTTALLATLGFRGLVGTAPLLGWPTRAWHVAAFGLALPDGVVATLCIARTLAVVAFLLGLRAREAGVAAALLGWAVLSQDTMAYVNTLHLLFAGMLVLGMAGAGSAIAAVPQPEIDPPSGIGLVRAFVVSVYAWSGLAKLNASWLGGDALADLRAAGIVRGGLADTLLASHAGCTAAAWIIVVAELALGPLLLWRRTRIAAVLGAILFHIALEVSVHPDVFGYAMVVLLLAFVDRPLSGTPSTSPPLLATR